jgi:hypothetical protein
MKGTDVYYEQKEEPSRSCLLALRDIILNHDSDITETRKYGMPCFCVAHKAICYLWTDKESDHPYILFVDGINIDHPRLEKGDRARMKILRIDPLSDLEIKIITEILTLAIHYHYRKQHK